MWSLVQALLWMIWSCSWLAWGTQSQTWPSATPASSTCFWNWRTWSVSEGGSINLNIATRMSKLNCRNARFTFLTILLPPPPNISQTFAVKFQGYDMVGMGSITVTYRQVCENAIVPLSFIWMINNLFSPWFQWLHMTMYNWPRYNSVFICLFFSFESILQCYRIRFLNVILVKRCNFWSKSC